MTLHPIIVRNVRLIPQTETIHRVANVVDKLSFHLFFAMPSISCPVIWTVSWLVCCDTLTSVIVICLPFSTHHERIIYYATSWKSERLMTSCKCGTVSALSGVINKWSITYSSNKQSKLFFFIHTWKHLHNLGITKIFCLHQVSFAPGNNKIIQSYRNSILVDKRVAVVQTELQPWVLSLIKQFTSRSAGKSSDNYFL